MGAILSLFRPTAVEPQLRAHLTALTPLGAWVLMGEPADAGPGARRSDGWGS